MLTWVVYRFHRGKGYYKRKVINNEEALLIEVNKFFETQKVPTLDKRSQWPKVRYLEDKMINHFRLNLKIYLPAKITQMCQTPQMFINYARFVDVVLRLEENDVNDFYMKTNKLLMKPKRIWYQYFFNFILNYIQSDLYMYKHE